MPGMWLEQVIIIEIYSGFKNYKYESLYTCKMIREGGTGAMQRPLGKGKQC